MTDQEQVQQVLLLDREWERQQIRSFTLWINFHLKRVGLHIDDITTDLRDGRMLHHLLEVISGDKLSPSEKKNHRVHQINNVNRCLEFIAKKGVKLAGIGSEEIVDGNLKMTLGCIWVIILRFAIQISDELGKHDGLLLWVKKKTEGYRGVNVTNFTSSFKDGLAFNALIHRHRPELLNYDVLQKENDAENLTQAFDIADKALGIPRMLDVEDTRTAPDPKSVMTYISAFYHEFSKNQLADSAARRINRVLDTNEENAKKIQDYERISSDLLEWINKKIDDFKESGPEDQQLDQLLERVNDINKYRKDEKPPRAKEKAELENLISSIKTRMHLQKRPDFVPMEGHSIKDVHKAWDNLNHFEKTLLDRLYLNIQRLYYIEHIIKKFYYKCDQQDNWMKGRLDSLKVDVSNFLMPEISALKRKHIELTNDIETREPRLKLISNLHEKLTELNCHQLDSVNARHSKIMSDWKQLKEAHTEFSEKLSQREKFLLDLDNLKQLYAQKASELVVYLDIAIEDLNDTYHVNTVSEAEDLQKELNQFVSTISENEKKLTEAAELEEKIRESSDPTNLYCSINVSDLQSKLQQVKDAVEARRSALSSENNNQNRNDNLRKDFAKLANEIEEFKNQRIQEIQATTQGSVTLEDNLAVLKKIAQNIDSFYKEKSPLLESMGKSMQEYQIFHNTYTSHTLESINADYQSLFDLIASSINEVENQIIVRDESNITEQQVKDYRKCFDYFDKERLNFLGYPDFRNFLVSLEYNVTEGEPTAEREFQRILKKVDSDNYGKVTFNNFLNFVAAESKHSDSAEEIIESFRALAGGRDYITPELIRQHMPQKAENIISKMSPSSDPSAPAGALDFKSFAATLYGESEL
ncbi:hypothetical protein HZS_3952 [Henneguya salminicola]|uniref:Alpha-actinin-1 (Trinotate prediction) n=1 Tax=Henneguya salminicola TaxID=69463 RepID=A0A6B2FZ50_HENSL|nr:hypothetical protein HZS_3952 [Henneguya salminicola]